MRPTLPFETRFPFSLVLIAALLAACSSPADTPDAGPSRDSSLGDIAQSDLGPTGGTDTGADAAPACVPLFGVPGERTGLGDDLCGPSCGCDATVARTYAPSEIDGWLQWELAEPIAEVVDDPYDAEPPPAPNDGVCTVAFDAASGSYRLETRAEPTADALLTHSGACGACSTLQDLAAYIRNPDLTGPVRECGLQGIRDGKEANLSCLQDLGFTLPCAQIWYYNTVNTRTACLVPCFELIDAPYHTPDGGLNECLACDETQSGPVFKHVAGRTRRNSGLASAICRPCASVTTVTHDYPTR